MAEEAICCTLVNCNCDNFKPGKLKRRQCENCKHGWVAHALSKLKVHQMYQSSQVEIVHSNVVFDICSLMLYGTQAIPIRLKILLDRLFSVLKQEEVIQILNALDWTLQDYIRGYVLQDVAGKVLDRWAMMTFEEEIATLQQFLRFGETKSIVELMALQDKEGQSVLVPSTRTSSDIRTFIERNTPCTAANMSTNKAERQSSNNMHHFENFINSMAFMLPFQLLGSVPAPFLGSPTGSHQQLHQQHRQSFHSSVEPQSEIQDDQKPDSALRENHLHVPLPAESSHVCSSSVMFTADLDQSVDKPLDSLSSTTKIEAEDFSTSDNYSDGPPTPCTPSMSSDGTQMSPEGKLRNGNSGGGNFVGNGGVGSLKKGRVFCNACEKTFYDKGTLKIHYNAVHLKIKHKCTIEGCNMVFSSLRSRNRHSANPNPRLHMPMNRNNRDKDLRGTLSADEGSPREKRPEYGSSILICSPESHKSVPSYMVSQVDTCPKIHTSSFPSIGQSGILFPNLKTVQPVLPFYRSLVTPAELANTPGTLPSLPLLSSSVSVKPTTVPDICNADPIPKKKSRKSSMPIKIEKEMLEPDEQMDMCSNTEDDRDKEECVDHQAGQTHFDEHKENREYLGEDGERQCRRPLFAQNFDMTREDLKEDAREGKVDAETNISRSPPFKNRLVKTLRGNPLANQELISNEESNGRECKTPLHEDDHLPELKWSEHSLTNGSALQVHEKERSEVSADDHADSGSSEVEQNADQFHHCDVCSMTLENPHSVKMHYQNVHLKEMHVCTVDGCTAAFTSRRSRDRHSANLTLHHKLMTKDPVYTGNNLYSASSHRKDSDSIGTMDYCQDQCDRDLTSVICRGKNRMGLVYPMSKMPTAPETPPKGDTQGLRGGGDGTVLDLSTSSSVPPHCSSSAPSYWDSDEVVSEDGEGVGGDVEALPMEDSEESCDGSHVGRPGGEQSLHGGEKSSVFGGEVQIGLQGVGSGSPITCHMCQKVYSNKGTFRAHYKTVHLRLLHKCKVPGCDTTFSSVRSRNRHSQNPNLHRNLVVSAGAKVEQEDMVADFM
uniref:zinc finger protein basonuclin-1 isoform X1 n=2 Tax=Doryrhamphus excisus TaxID=161450 RepID=UPI0025AE7155|nr:zinc finger protein basonuclin-1 isoform X1 [Doryrhamphus excisus]